MHHACCSQILIGRNNRQNDDLSNRVANPNDVWMHVRGIPGSHAVIRWVAPDRCRGAAVVSSRDNEEGMAVLIGLHLLGAVWWINAKPARITPCAEKGLGKEHRSWALVKGRCGPQLGCPEPG